MGLFLLFCISAHNVLKEIEVVPDLISEQDVFIKSSASEKIGFGITRCHGAVVLFLAQISEDSGKSEEQICFQYPASSHSLYGRYIGMPAKDIGKPFRSRTVFSYDEDWFAQGAPFSSYWLSNPSSWAEEGGLLVVDALVSCRFVSMDSTVIRDSRWDSQRIRWSRVRWTSRESR